MKKKFNQYNINIYEFKEAAKKSDKQFLCLLEEYLNTYEIKDCIQILKMTKICVDIASKGTFLNLYKQALELIETKAGNNNIYVKKLKREVALFNNLFKEINDLKEDLVYSDIAYENQIEAFLISLEMLLGYNNGLLSLKNEELLNEIYPQKINFAYESEIPFEFEKDFNYISFIIDFIVENCGLILNELISKYGLDINTCKDIPVNEVNAAFSHFSILDKYIFLYNSYVDWCFLDCKLVIQKDIAKLTYTNEALAREIYISSSIFMNSRLTFMGKVGAKDLKLKEPILDSNTIVLPPKFFRSESEVISTEFFHNYFGTSTLKEACFNISLAEWIRAFSLLNELSTKHVYERNSKPKCNLQDWTIAKTKDEWIKIFIDGGISPEAALNLINKLTFKKGSSSLGISPFIRAYGKLIVIPSILSVLEPSMELLNSFTKDGVQVSFKGNCFEEKVRNKLSNIGIKNVKVKEFDSNRNEYDCDSAFVFDSSLFLLEIKSFIQPAFDSEKYFLLINKLYTASNQLCRVSDYYSRNLDRIRKLLGLSSDWNPKAIYRFIVTNAYVGDNIKLKNCYIVNDICLYNFFTKSSPCVRRLGQRGEIDPYIPFLEGDLTTSKLLKYIENQPTIVMAKAAIEKTELTFQLNNTSFRKIKFESLLNTFIIEENMNQNEKQKLKQMMQSFGKINK